MKFASIERLEDYVKHLNENAFYMSIEQDPGCFSIYANKNNVEKHDVNAKKYIAYVSNEYDFSKHFNTSSTLLKICPGQFSFYPIYDEATYERFFIPEPIEFCKVAIACVSHKLKQICYAYAFENDNHDILCIRQSNAQNTWISQSLDVKYFYQSLWIPNALHAKYHTILNGISRITGIFASINDYFAYQKEYNCYVKTQAIQSYKRDKDRHIKEIENIQKYIAI